MPRNSAMLRLADQQYQTTMHQLVGLIAPYVYGDLLGKQFTKDDCGDAAQMATALLNAVAMVEQSSAEHLAPLVAMRVRPRLVALRQTFVNLYHGQITGGSVTLPNWLEMLVMSTLEVLPDSILGLVEPTPQEPRNATG